MSLFSASYVSLETVIINPSGTIKFKHLSTGLYALSLRPLESVKFPICLPGLNRNLKMFRWNIMQLDERELDFCQLVGFNALLTVTYFPYRDGTAIKDEQPDMIDTLCNLA